MHNASLDKKARKIYNSHKTELETKHYGKIAVIDVDEGDIVTIGKDLEKVYPEARKQRSGHHLFLRRIGKEPAVARMR